MRARASGSHSRAAPQRQVMRILKVGNAAARVERLTWPQARVPSRANVSGDARLYTCELACMSCHHVPKCCRRRPTATIEREDRE
jgi:hypothetical protein